MKMFERDEQQQQDYEETMMDKEQQDEWNRVMGQCLPIIIEEMLRHSPEGDSLPIEILQYVEDMAEKVQARQLMPTASGARQVLDYPESKPLPSLTLGFEDETKKALNALTIYKSLPF
jgi:hypothetical protein